MFAIVTFGATAVLLFQTPTKYGSDRFRQIFIDHWEKWWNCRREEIPADQRAYMQKTVETMMGCRNPQCGYARYVCSICHEERIVPHLHLTLTIAKEMRPYFDRDRSLLKLLLTTAADAVRQVVAVTSGDIRAGLVYTDSFYPKGVVAAADIGRNMGHPPLAKSHLTLCDGRQVRFWYQETATGLRRDITLPG